MALYPTKVLLDKNKKPFIPFVTAESILFNNTDKSLADMLYERYTKEEVDNIIKNLGTVQVLRGRVDTYEDLLAIENPQAGDMYIVGTSETDNAEYIYIGTAWEKLGPLLDTTNLATLDDLENLADATITYNGLAARPTFAQTNDLIDSAINGTKDTRFLKYIGHYTDDSSLPFAGQESAELAITNPYTYTSDLRNPDFDIEAIKAIVAEPYFIGTYISPTEYSLIGFHNPNLLLGLDFLPDLEYKANDGGARVSSSVIVGVNFDYTPHAERIKLYSQRTSATSSRFTSSNATHMCWVYTADYSTGQRDTPKLLYNNSYKVFIQSAPNLCCNVPNKVFNYLQNTYGCLKVKTYDQPERCSAENSKTQMVLQFADNFVYDINMALLKFDENCQPVWFTAEGECTVNDILSYGEQGDYRRFNGEAWVPMGIQSSEVFNYVDNALGTAEAAVDAIIDGGA